MYPNSRAMMKICPPLCWLYHADHRDMRELTMDEVEEKPGSRDFNVAVYDIQNIPGRIFVLYRAWGERYDFDYAKEKRDHKLERERFGYGGMPCKSGPDQTPAPCGNARKSALDAVEEGRNPTKLTETGAMSAATVITTAR